MVSPNSTQTTMAAIRAATGDQFRLTTPESEISTYVFNRHVINHKFCKTCGMQPAKRKKTRSSWARSSTTPTNGCNRWTG